MCEVSFSADEVVLERAIEVARSEGKTLEAAVQEWLDSYASQSHEGYPHATAEEIQALFERLKSVRAGQKFTRDEMNER